jgi:HSP20 family molecular chaperone IbpA
MRYRRLSYRYTMVVRSGAAWPLGDVWPGAGPRPLARVGWRPDVDSYETAAAIEVTVDLAGLDEDDFEVQLFEDALVVEGHRRLPSCAAGAVYHEAGIRQGPFQVEVAFLAPVDAERVEARYDRGLLHITLPKPPGAG